MSFNFIWLFIMLFGLMALGAPVAMAMLISSLVYMWYFDMSFYSAAVQAISAPMSQTLLATGFFILAGNLMNRGGVTRKIFNFAKDIVGWIAGGLGHANVVASVIFAGMSGSATADAGGLGQIEIEAMTEDGYDLDFAVAVTGASSVLGPIIPPSIPAVMLAVITGVSTGRLFMAGVIPGLLCAVALMILVYIIAVKRGYPRTPFPPAKIFLNDFKAAFLPLLTPAIILGSIYNGVITPSEAAVMAGVYAIILGFLGRDLRVRELPGIFRETCQLLISILFIIIASKIFGYIITIERVPAVVSEIMLGNITSKFACLLVIMAILTVCGCVMDNTATIFIVTPVLFPIAVSMGIDPVHFCMVFIFTLMLGVVTPPVGMVLFVLQGMTGIPFGRMIKAMAPFLIVLFGFALILALFPGITTWLPTLVYG